MYGEFAWEPHVSFRGFGNPYMLGSWGDEAEEVPASIGAGTRAQEQATAAYQITTFRHETNNNTEFHS